MRTSAVAYPADVPRGRKADRGELSVVETIVGWRGSLRGIRPQLQAVAPTNTTVLLAGETGTGKGSHRARNSRTQPAPRTQPGQGELRRDARRDPYNGLGNRCLSPIGPRVGWSAHCFASGLSGDSPPARFWDSLVNREKHSGINGPSPRTPGRSLPDRNGVLHRV
jgi:hypothetical protein